MRRFTFSRGRASAACAILAILILLVITVLIIDPVPVEKHLSIGDARISFSGNRSLIAAPGNCITASWQVDGIKAVYLNDQGVVGSGQQSLCLQRDSRPALRVVLLDNSEHIIHLDTIILTQQPAFWISLIAALALLLIAIYQQATRKRVRATLQPRWWRPLITALALIPVGIIAALVLMEIGLRVYFGLFGTPQDKLLYVDSTEEIEKEMVSENAIVPLPYLNYGLNPAYHGHNSMGYRGPEIAMPKPPGTFRIVAMGDSTTYGLGMDASNAYPAQLQDILRQQYGYSNVEVINAGVIGYTSWETFINLSLRVIELEPDMVIIYDGTNDVSARTATADCYAGDNPFAACILSGRSGMLS